MQTSKLGPEIAREAGDWTLPTNALPTDLVKLLDELVDMWDHQVAKPLTAVGRQARGAQLCEPWDRESVLDVVIYFMWIETRKEHHV
jgi:hypothetical protein